MAEKVLPVWFGFFLLYSKKSQITREISLLRYMQFSTPHLVSNNGKRFSLYSTLLYARATVEYPFARGVEIRSVYNTYYCDRVLRSSAFGDILRLTEPTRCGRVCFCSSWVAFVRSFPCQAFWVFSLFALLRNLARSSLLLSFCYDGGNSDFPVAATGAAATRQTRVAFWFTMVLQLWQSTTGCKLVVLVVSLE